MSDRADGWLLILGGLAIGLVLWLSPSKNLTSQNLQSMASRDLNELLNAVINRHRTNLEHVLTICLADLCVRLECFDPLATE